MHCAANNFAQSPPVDKLKKELTAAKSPHEITDLKNAISYELRVSNADSSLLFARSALAIAEKENYEYGKAVADICIALAHSVKGNYHLTEEFAGKALIIGGILKNDSLNGAANLALSVASANLGEYEKALEQSMLAIKYYSIIKNDKGIVKARLSIAQMYQLKGSLAEATGILQELSAQPMDDKKIEVNILHTLANIYGMEEKYQDALDLDEKALLICQKNNLTYLTSPVYDNMGNCYMYKGDAAKAREYFYKCLAIDSSFSNKKQMADTYLNIGQLDVMKNDFASAIQQLRHSIMLSTESGYREGTFRAYVLLSEAFAKNNHKDSALNSINKGYLIKDSLINERSENRMAEMETLYQSERKEQQLALQKSQLNKKNYYLIALCIFISLITLYSILYYRKRSLQNKVTLQHEVLHQQDLATKAIIEAEENERKRIAADLHDGIGQMMSAAKMNLSVFEQELNFSNEEQRSKFENVIGLVDESCKEIRNVSHQMMPNALLKSGLASAVKEFLSKIDTRIIKVSLHTEGLNERLEGNIETVLYRVIQECVNNVLKHSEANHMDISIIKDKEGIAATIEDNGKGFDIGGKKGGDGLGLKNTASRIQYLKGTIDFASSPGKGTVVAIHIPV